MYDRHIMRRIQIHLEDLQYEEIARRARAEG
jgi:hypothetical protein